MGEHYSASRIGADDADLAFPLLSLRYPDLSLQDWRKTVRRLTRMPREHGGLVMVRDLRGRVFAVFAYRSGGTLDGGDVLRVSDVLMGRLPGDLLPSAVVAAATQLAGELGHPRVAIEYADEGFGSDAAGVLSKAGFEDGGRLLVRTAAEVGGGRQATPGFFAPAPAG
ncbi:hypothetical protein [Methylobacterium dankookense]|jgi:hypothetical protein|uniref:N-acetyltransferase domain-containing protein n=1 Tax=Methylobacterium dankookense TaxID=560405 RepID=A0A564G6B9_9HYPH|nr:hypothetical protein [Methylobacterium dankookense]GJD58338.1 hypothetical protein IFDJLNFL_4257 [Methylobacterium dankookense]VUF15574.1 hypothetical protein MTDSW087_05317 [Methylobacterium dankookense]